MLTVQSFVFNPFSENTYVISNDHKKGVIVDPGNVTEHETLALQNYIEDHELDIKNILLTHAHIDHVLGLQWCFDRYKVPVLLHRDDQEILERNPMSARQFGFFFKPFNGEVQYLAEGEVYELDDDVLKVMHVPGHSPGSIAYYCESQNFIISGDVLFQGSIGRTDLYKGDHAQLLQGIKTKIFSLPEITKVYSGHGNPTQVGFEKENNRFFK